MHKHREHLKPKAEFTYFVMTLPMYLENTLIYDLFWEYESSCDQFHFGMLFKET